MRWVDYLDFTGKRAISEAQAKKLGEIFNISASVFIRKSGKNPAFQGGFAGATASRPYALSLPLVILPGA